VKEAAARRSRSRLPWENLNAARHGRIVAAPGLPRLPRPFASQPARPSMQIINTFTVLALVVLSFALIVAIPVLYASSDDSGRSNRLILIGSAAWVALVLLNWGVSFLVV